MQLNTEKKRSFEELAVEDDNLLHNSNMLNLVSAHKRLSENIKWHQTQIENGLSLQREIKEFSDGDDLQNTDRVKELFSKANKLDTAEFTAKRY